MKLVLTGAAGFLGIEVERQLKLVGIKAAGVDIRPDRNVFSQVDVSSVDFSSLVEAVKPSVIVHLAGVQYLNTVPRTTRESFFRSNITMAQNVARSMHELSTLSQVVFVSTDMVYGKQNHSPVSSQAELSPIGHYGHSKLQAESILLQASLATGIPVTIFRPRLIAGAGRLGTLERLHGLVSRNLPIPIIGKGLNKYQFIAKEDVAKAILLAIGTQSSRVYNLGSDDPPKVKDLLSNAIELVGSKSRLLYLNEFTSLKALRALDWLGLSPLSPEQFEIANLNCVLDTSETKRELGWQPTKSDLQILLESFDHLNRINGLDVK